MRLFSFRLPAARHGLPRRPAAPPYDTFSALDFARMKQTLFGAAFSPAASATLRLPAIFMKHSLCKAHTRRIIITLCLPLIAALRHICAIFVYSRADDDAEMHRREKRSPIYARFLSAIDAVLYVDVENKAISGWCFLVPSPTRRCRVIEEELICAQQYA